MAVEITGAGGLLNDDQSRESLILMKNAIDFVEHLGLTWMGAKRHGHKMKTWLERLIRGLEREEKQGKGGRAWIVMRPIREADKKHHGDLFYNDWIRESAEHRMRFLGDLGFRVQQQHQILIID